MIEVQRVHAGFAYSGCVVCSANLARCGISEVPAAVQARPNGPAAVALLIVDRRQEPVDRSGLPGLAVFLGPARVLDPVQGQADVFSHGLAHREVFSRLSGSSVQGVAGALAVAVLLWVHGVVDRL